MDPIEGAISLPPRADDALIGTAFASSIMGMPLGQEREEAIQKQILAGNVPSWSRVGLAVPTAHNGHTCVFWALPDYLSVGRDEDFIRVPMNPITATAIADVADCVLPTRAMVNAIWTAAYTKLIFKNLPPTAEMTSTKWFVDHQGLVQEQLQALGRSPSDGIVAGHKKDVVICKAFEDSRPYPPGHGDRVAIYGWCASISDEGAWTVIQGLNPTSHNNKYADYSHGIRLVLSQVLVDGNTYMSARDVLENAELAGLLSDEGPLTVVRYPET